MTATPILYDPDCGFCRVCVAFLLTWDRAGRLKPVALGTDEANDLLRGMPTAEQMASWHLAEPRWGNHPEIRSGGAGFSVLFRLLPRGTPFALVAERFPGAADKAYRWVADRRSAFGRPIPDRVKRWANRVIQASESAAESR